MNNSEEFILPPEGDGHGNRHESADLDIDELKSFIEDTQFESKEALFEILTRQYGMAQRSSEFDVDANVTSTLRRPTTDELRRMMKGEVIDSDFDMKPVSGEKPELALHEMVKMTDGSMYDLQVFKVLNRNQIFRYEYILEVA